MKFTPLNVKGAFLITLAPVMDARGSFTRVFCADTLAAQTGFKKPVRHINHSVTAKTGAIRGLRYQIAPAVEAKVVRCLRGRTYDVIVDLRKGSPTFLQISATALAPNAAVFMPEGCAHGFQTLEDGCEVMYITSEPWNKACERSVRYSDPLLGISWPLAATDISDHDAAIPFLEKNFGGV